MFRYKIGTTLLENPEGGELYKINFRIFKIIIILIPNETN